MTTTLEKPIDPETGRTFTGTMECMDSSGDLKMRWDKDNPEEVAAAKATFDKMTKGRAHTAFASKKDVAKAKRMDTFDPDAERMILVKQYQGG